MRTPILSLLTLLALASPALAQRNTTPEPYTPPTLVPAPSADDLKSAIAKSVELLLAMQETDPSAAAPAPDQAVQSNPDHRREWPYEGVYRVGGKIPIGYRIGGTGIVATALLRAPGYAADPARHAAIHRAVTFLISGTENPLMNPDYDGGYDVRGWGYTYAAHCLLALKAADALPADLKDKAEQTLKWYLKAIELTEIPGGGGGWNYARAPGKEAVSPSSPFMTGPTLHVLFEARRQSYDVSDDIVNRALKSLQAGRTNSGSVVYSGEAGKRSGDATPGAVGRMLATETTLLLAGDNRSSIPAVRGSLDAFLVHWEWLDRRRAKQGTHVAPYGVAPYYFYFAHYFAAEAIEMLPENERAEYRRRLNQLIFSVRLEGGQWNDRVFPRTANFGTSFVLLALTMPESPRPAAWEPGGADTRP